MSNNEFDRLVAEKLKQTTFTYDPGDWDKLTVQLADARRKKRTILFVYKASGIAASLLVCAIGISLLLSKKEIATTVNIPYHTTSKIAMSAPATPSTTIKTQTQNPVISANRSKTFIVATKKTNKTQLLVNVGTITNTTSSLTAAPAAMHDSGNSAVAQTTLVEKFAQVDKKSIPQQKSVALPLPAPSIQEEVAVVKKNINISVGGGVNYGTLNAGYALNAVADKRISNKMSIEVTMGYINNSSTTATSYGGSNYNPVNTAHSITNTTTNTTPLNYLQFSPVAGYNVSKKIIVGAGADLQRLLEDHETTVIYNDKEKVAPMTDIGLLLKTDYAVTTRLKGGVSYRIGANNLLSAGNNYIDRNYMQVQLKYRLH
ncbi:MAG: hypothetical protein P4L41_03740 [Flavipsychrobacter sp.]|nr:hypothetical protein [Flavipsychrobacter sp.]